MAGVRLPRGGTAHSWVVSVAIRADVCSVAALAAAHRVVMEANLHCGVASRVWGPVTWLRQGQQGGRGLLSGEQFKIGHKCTALKVEISGSPLFNGACAEALATDGKVVVSNGFPKIDSVKFDQGLKVHEKGEHKQTVVGMTEVNGSCHGPGCSRSRRVTGSYGRSTGIEDLVDTSREHGRSAVSMETMDSYGITCKGGPSHMRGGPGTATRRTKLKEHADGYHSGAQETRVEGADTRS
ncbi:hypothetical protein NDA12_006735 [Ustilago hordei]|nr:hypothetical protein NDA15_007295 [Ustilago hordei]KAJ1590374.1 hypothetical protein NDA12_006735 [Ustilago hordei]